MANLKTNYLGIELRNPVILGASNLTNKLDHLKQAEDAGVGAIVYKSLFEEQIQLETAQLEDALDEYNDRNAEMITLFPTLQHAGPDEHLVNLRKVKESLSIPVIGSLNAIYKETWVEYALKMEQTGIDALELNFYAVPRELDIEGQKIIDDQIKTLEAVKEKVSIPVSVKLSSFYANPLNIIKAMDETGVSGFVLFNRLFQPDIDINAQKHTAPFILSTPEDNRLPLRFAGLLYGKVKADICSNTGIFSGEDVIKMILAGANCVQVVSTLYKNGIDYISSIVVDIAKWMDEKGYDQLSDFRGKLSNLKINDPFVYKRAQYIDLLLKSDGIFKKYPMV